MIFNFLLDVHSLSEMAVNYETVRTEALGSFRTHICPREAYSARGKLILHTGGDTMRSKTFIPYYLGKWMRLCGSLW